MTIQSDDKSRVLIVDDDRMNINILNDILKQDYKVKVAMDGEQALERALSDPQPDLILLDIVMPGMDGFEACKRLQLDPRTVEIPIIFITAKNSEKDEIKGLELGGVDFIPKPIRPEIVRARVRTHLLQMQQKRELKAMNERILALSVTDALTDIPNRRHFDDFFQQEWIRSCRSQTPLGLLMMDIDYFKRYNDHYGHDGGDQCLKQVAQLLASNVRRPPDLVARYGGEEFACVLPDTDLAGVRIIGHTLLKAIQDMAIPHTQSEVAPMVTMSIGGTALVPTKDKAAVEMLRVADGLLYTSKHDGRNRLTVQSAYS
ncbi:diguanylate cyclase domain-containing protein [Magnetococcus sp. PR-3]|uniref:diguanylate cyclase domain-containing protein n=1 Tax=Magnetococcus sp. PR-3 TaxID=3120355 RepID=UPI002FCE58BC